MARFRMSVTTYKHSPLATIVSFLGNLCFILAAIFLIIPVTSIIGGDFDASLLIVGLVMVVIFGAIGVGLWILADKIAVHKQKKMSQK